MMEKCFELLEPPSVLRFFSGIISVTIFKLAEIKLNLCGNFKDSYSSGADLVKYMSIHIYMIRYFLQNNRSYYAQYMHIHL
jgi:hypothetical protein